MGGELAREGHARDLRLSRREGSCERGVHFLQSNALVLVPLSTLTRFLTFRSQFSISAPPLRKRSSYTTEAA